MVTALIWTAWVLTCICGGLIMIGTFRLVVLLWRERVDLHSIGAVALMGLAAYGAYLAAGVYLVLQVT